MNVKMEAKVTIETDVFIDGNIIKSHSCDLGDWWGSEVCQRVSIDDMIEMSGLPRGEYKVIVSLEKI
jgi:hypothetical protein